MSRATGGKPARHWSTYLRGQRKERGQMNKTEAAYARQLELLRAAGEVLWWAYEAVTLRLTDTTAEGRPGIRYTPDFAVLPARDQVLEFHEVKGHEGAEGLLRLKMAADQFPARFFLVKRAKRGTTFTSEEV